jgi:hypothetical protein
VGRSICPACDVDRAQKHQFEAARSQIAAHRKRENPPGWVNAGLWAREYVNSFEAVMSDQDHWDFAGADDAKVTIRAAVRYLLRGTTDGIRGDIVQEIIAIVRQVSNGSPPRQPDDPLDDDMPGG